MLSIHWIQDVDYYLDQATADYYFRPGEPPGRWWGEGAKSLGLIGTVKAQQLKALCKGYSPEGEALTQNAGDAKHQQAWDLTLSAPKSVSVLWTQAPRATRLKIRKLHHKASKAALDYLTEVALLTRRGKGGLIRERARPIVAIFEHGSNRELEPQLHSHCVLLNVAARADGTFGTILSKPFYDHKLTAGAIYQIQLAHLLRSELGLRIEKQETAFDVVGIPQELLDHYSTRSKQIRQELGSKGSHTSKAAAQAALATRKSKRNPPPPRAELLKRWQATNLEFGFTEKDAERLLGKIGPLKSIPDLSGKIDAGIQELLESESYFSEQRLIRNVVIQVMGEGIAANHVIEQVRTYIATQPDIVPIGIFHDEPQFTTQEMLGLEKQLYRAIEESSGEPSHAVRSTVVEQLLDKELPLGSQLTEDESHRNREQRAAVLKLTTAPGSIAVLEGMAGAGKTYTLSVARKAWEKAGYQVTGMALSAVAARNLQEGSGIPSETIAMRLLQLDGRRNFAHHHKRQLKRLLTGKRTFGYSGRQFSFHRNSIVIVDEAGMVGTRQMVQLMEHVRKAGAKLVLIGDRRQLQPVDAGGPFRPVADGTPKALLKHVVRQTIEPDDPNPNWHREAGKLISAGDVARAIKLFAERGRFHVYKDLDWTMLSMVRNWSVEGITNPNDHILLAGTNAAVAQLNARCQSARLSAGVLGSTSIEIGESQIHVGDIVLFTKNSRLCGVNNGDRAVVLAFNPLRKTMAVKLQANDKTVLIPYRSYTDFQLGYAMTTHKAQGATVPGVHVLLGSPMQDLHLSYVQSTRARESTRLYVDKQNAGPKLKSLLQQMQRNRPKRLATEVQAINASGSSTDSVHSGAFENQSVEPAAHGNTEKAKKRKASKRTEKAAPPIKTPEKVRHPKYQVSSPSRPKAGLASGMLADTPSQAMRPPSSSARPAAKGHDHVTRVASPPVRASGSIGDISEQRGSETHRANPLPTPPAPKMVTVAGNKNVPENPSPAQVTRDQTASDASTRRLVPQSDLPPRDILDLSHVTVVTTTDMKFLRAAVERYGRLPGGIVVEGDAYCPVQITSLAVDPTRPTHLLINGCKVFDTGLSPEEVALIWHAVLETDRSVKDFGALSQREAIGIDVDTKVGVTMLKADNALGGITYGYDSQYNLGKEPGPNHRNPFIEETEKVLLPSAIQRLFFNYLNKIVPQLFLTVTDVRFSESTPGVLRVASTQVTAALALATWEQALVTTPLLSVQSCFPLVHKALQALVAHFGDHARMEPCVARTIAYAELVSLLRRAKTAKACLAGRDHVRSLVAKRQRMPLPRFNYTLRSKEFVTVAGDAARQLSSTESTWFDGLMATTIGIHYASLAGDFSTFLRCKQHALTCISRLQTHTFYDEYRQLSQALPGLAERIRSCCHDALIEACIEAACNSSCPQEEKLAYLNEAVRLCGSPATIKQIAASRCRRLEAKSYLRASFDPVPDLAKVRADDPTTMLSFSTLTRIKARNQHGGNIPHSADRIRFAIAELKQQLGFAKLGKEYADLWLTLIDKLSDQRVLSVLKELKRLGLPLQEYLTTLAADNANEPDVALWKLLARRLTDLPATSFSTRFLHRDNPFVTSHELLDYESPANLAHLFVAVRREVERFDFLIRPEKSGLRKLFSTILPLDLQGWWAQFLKAHAPPSGSETSKVALLLAHELRVRGRTVKDLYDRMREHRTKNPQAALFLLDLKAATRAAKFSPMEQRNK
jgi:conjugative relaxase-like TrwC/TraI family protein